jgi:hypothetical protein
MIEGDTKHVGGEDVLVHETGSRFGKANSCIPDTLVRLWKFEV